ncbi:MAG TPA: cytidylate kinase-like family protein [Candidatus Dormibacteraeota bacterium]
MVVAAIASYFRSGSVPSLAITTAWRQRVAPTAAATQAPAAIAPIRRPVVTISASFGALGSEIAPQVAERLGVPFVDRAIPMRVAELLHVPLGAALEHDDNIESGVARIIAGAVDAIPQYGIEPPPPAEHQPTEESIREATSTVLHEMAATTGGVFLGRGGMVVLRDQPQALHVRLDGSEAGRLSQAIAHGVPKDSVHRLLWQTDHAREAYMHTLYDVDLHDPRLYHLVLDTTRVPADTCVDAIVSAASAVAVGDAAPAPPDARSVTP